MAGGSSLEGFTVSSANEVMVGAIAKELAKHPNSTVDANGKYIDNSDVYKIASLVLGKSFVGSNAGNGIASSATENNYLTHIQIKQYLKEYNEALDDEEKALVDKKWQNISLAQKAQMKEKLKSLSKSIFKNQIDLHNPLKQLAYQKAYQKLLTDLGYYNNEFSGNNDIMGKGKLMISIAPYSPIIERKKLSESEKIIYKETLALEKAAKEELRKKGLNPDAVSSIPELAKVYSRLKLKLINEFKLKRVNDGAIMAPQKNAYAVDKIYGTDTYFIRRANVWERSGPDVGGPSGVATWGLGTATLGKIQGNAVDIGLRFEHENRLLESVDGHLGGVQGKAEASITSDKVGVEVGGMIYASAVEAKSVPLKFGQIQVSLEAEGYAGALGGHLEAYGDRKKRKLKFKVGLAKVVGGSIGINVEENEDRKKEREALDKR